MKTLSVVALVFGLFLRAQAQTVAYYHFEPVVGTPTMITDSGPNGLHGSTVGTVAFIPGVPGNAIDLTGDLNYVSVPHSSNFVMSNSWTIELFFKFHLPYTVYGSDPSHLIAKQHTSSAGNSLCSFEIAAFSDGRLYGAAAFALNQGVGVDTGTQVKFNDGQWHHVALVYNSAALGGGKSLSIYVDYVLRGVSTGTYPAIAWGALPVFIGAGNFPGGTANGPFRRNFDGKIDEVRVSNVALDPSAFITLQPGNYGLLGIENTGSAARISWPTTANAAYQLQYRSLVNTGSWTNLGGPFSGDGTDVHLLDPLPGAPTNRFYQVIETQ